MTNFERHSDSSRTTAAMADTAGQPEWFDKFMSNAARTFGIAAGTKRHPGDMATAFDQRDLMTLPKTGEALGKTIAGSCTMVIEDAGHSMMAEAPDAVLDALAAFFSAK